MIEGEKDGKQNETQKLYEYLQHLEDKEIIDEEGNLILQPAYGLSGRSPKKMWKKTAIAATGQDEAAKKELWDEEEAAQQEEEN